MPRLIDGDRTITGMLYNEQTEEHEDKKMSVIEYLNAYTDEGVTVNDLVNAIVIPEGATNGDMIKALFNDFESALLVQVISKEWWNAPYKKVEEE